MGDHRIEVRCCDCGQHMGWKDGGSEPGLVSHSYCPVCKKAAYAQLEAIERRSNEESKGTY